MLASLNHPHIAAIYGLERSGAAIALVMELVDGEDLSQRIAHGALPLDEALAIARQIAEALEAAHARTDQVVMMNVYIVGYTEADLEELAHCTAAYFPPDRLPASTLVPVPRLARNELLFEIDVTAVIPTP